MRRTTMAALLAALLALGPGACSSGGHGRAVYLLMDTSGTYTKELDRANAIVNYLLGTLEPGDSLAAARIDSASFSEKDIVARTTFDGRPSKANDQKRAFREAMSAFFSGLESAQYTDISGGLLQAGEWLDETGAGQRHVLVFSDLKQELPPGHKRDFELPLRDTHVVALNVAKLRPDQVDPERYLDRVAEWRARVEAAGGTFRVINDLSRLEGLLRPS